MSNRKSTMEYGLTVFSIWENNFTLFVFYNDIKMYTRWKLKQIRIYTKILRPVYRKYAKPYMNMTVGQTSIILFSCCSIHILL